MFYNVANHTLIGKELTHWSIIKPDLVILGFRKRPTITAAFALTF